MYLLKEEEARGGDNRVKGRKGGRERGIEGGGEDRRRRKEEEEGRGGSGEEG